MKLLLELRDFTLKLKIWLAEGASSIGENQFISEFQEYRADLSLLANSTCTALRIKEDKKVREKCSNFKNFFLKKIIGFVQATFCI